MNNSESNVSRKAFRHIYVEDAAWEYARTEEILLHFPSAEIIRIADYKHVFNRPRQASALQKQAPDLILAVSKQPCIYPGAPVCQSFGEEHFYYTSCVMNCPYDCEYCYLQGMYPSGNIVIFVNLEDTFQAIDELLVKHPLYLCISFDTDLLALENITGFLGKWCAFLSTRPDLIVEVRTKSAAVSVLASLPVVPNMILAITMSPDEVIQRYEHHTPSLTKRISLGSEALAKGRPLRLCFDPMLAFPGWEDAYRGMFRELSRHIDFSRLRDVSVGSFRISADYLKDMRERRPCETTAYPYTLTNGVYHYDTDLLHRMMQLCKDELAGLIAPEKIFFWEDTNE